MDSHKNTQLKKKRAILVFAFVAIFALGWFFGHEDRAFNSVGYTPKLTNTGEGGKNVDFGVFWRAWELLEDKYDGQLDYQKMVYGAIRGMTAALGDPYTSFLSPEEAKALSDDLSGKVSGIGAEIGIKNNKLTVISPINDSPAKEAGILAGDNIVYVNDEPTDKMTVFEAVSKIRGKAGTKVKISIQRNGSIKEFEITRAEFTVKSVKMELKSGNIGYVSISRFDENTDDLLRDALLELNSKDIKKIVLDLRDNPGGYLDQSINVASEFIKSGTIVSERKETGGGKMNNYKATGKGVATERGIKIIVLVNSGSASASEIVAGALKDYNRGVLVGEKTYGKGSVQKLENMAGGAELRVTIAHWYTPSGKNISKEGIKPDYEVKLTDDDYNNDRDPQLEKALDLLK